MIKIGITGSLASGKTTASKILSNTKHPLFNADKEVQNLYKKKFFRKLISKKLKIRNNAILKKEIKKKIIKKELSIKELENIIHPLVRKKMREFLKKNKNKKIIFFEIPLLIENKLMKLFDVIIFIKSSQKNRLKRFILKGGDKKIFRILNKKQLNDKKKIKYSDHIVVNDNNLNILKKRLSDIVKLYV